MQSGQRISATVQGATGQAAGSLESAKEVCWTWKIA